MPRRRVRSYIKSEAGVLEYEEWNSNLLSQKDTAFILTFLVGLGGDVSKRRHECEPRDDRLDFDRLQALKNDTGSKQHISNSR